MLKDNTFCETLYLDEFPSTELKLISYFTRARIELTLLYKKDPQIHCSKIVNCFLKDFLTKHPQLKFIAYYVTYTLKENVQILIVFEFTDINPFLEYIKDYSKKTFNNYNDGTVNILGIRCDAKIKDRLNAIITIFYPKRKSIIDDSLSKITIISNKLKSNLDYEILLKEK